MRNLPTPFQALVECEGFATPSRQGCWLGRGMSARFFLEVPVLRAPGEGLLGFQSVRVPRAGLLKVGIYFLSGFV
jgi:hypothetical protein